jgi:hypothetical protein
MALARKISMPLQGLTNLPANAELASTQKNRFAKTLNRMDLINRTA